MRLSYLWSINHRDESIRMRSYRVLRSNSIFVIKFNQRKWNYVGHPYDLYTQARASTYAEELIKVDSINQSEVSLLYLCLQKKRARFAHLALQQRNNENDTRVVRFACSPARYSIALNTNANGLLARNQ